MNPNPTLTHRISTIIAKNRVPTTFPIKEAFDRIPQTYGARTGRVVEAYVNSWLANNQNLKRITTSKAYQNRVEQRFQGRVNISQDRELNFLNPDGTKCISFDGLYLHSNTNIPIEVKSGNTNGYLKHLQLVQETFYSLFGKGKFIHPVFLPLREDTHQFVVPKLEKAVEKFPELAFIDISDLVHEVELVNQEMLGITKKLKQPYKQQNTQRTIITKQERKPSPKGRGRNKKKRK